MDTISIISQLGFPISACIAMAWYVKYITDRNMKQTDDMMERYTESLDTVRAAISNQTIAINALAAQLSAGTTTAYNDLKNEAIKNAAVNS